MTSIARSRPTLYSSHAVPPHLAFSGAGLLSTQANPTTVDVARSLTNGLWSQALQWKYETLCRALAAPAVPAVRGWVYSRTWRVSTRPPISTTRGLSQRSFVFHVFVFFFLSAGEFQIQRVWERSSLRPRQTASGMNEGQGRACDGCASGVIATPIRTITRSSVSDRLRVCVQMRLVRRGPTRQAVWCTGCIRACRRCGGMALRSSWPCRSAPIAQNRSLRIDRSE